ncbi:MAG TPA: hypothetical protein VGD77_06695 [Gemmatimonadaceae bacterium]
MILGDARVEGSTLLENPEFLRFARHWGFRVRACRPYRGKTKGKVECPIRYVRSNFFYGREFVGGADLDAQRLTWLEEVANARVHRTIRAVLRLRFEAEERAQLQPLAARAYRPLVLPEEAHAPPDGPARGARGHPRRGRAARARRLQALAETAITPAVAPAGEEVA